jgi:hypothetical protein
MIRGMWFQACRPTRIRIRPLTQATRNLLSSVADTFFMSCIKLENLNPRHLKVEYAVRGELAIKAEEYRIKLKQPNHGLPFDKVVSTNIGNPQQRGLDQKPLTFVRQVSLTVTHFHFESPQPNFRWLH